MEGVLAMKQMVVNKLFFGALVLVLSSCVYAAEKQTMQQSGDKCDVKNAKFTDGDAGGRDVVYLKKQLAVMKKMIAELSKELEDIEKCPGRAKRSFKSVDQI